MDLEAEKIFYQSLRLIHDGKIPEALDLLSETMDKHADFSRAWSAMGDLLSIHFNDLEKAESFYKKSIELAPEKHEAYIGYAALLIRMSRFAEANAQLNKASNISGVFKDKLFEQFGILNEAQSRLEDAVANYKKAIVHSFSNDLIASCESAINRCNLKKKYIS